jgi:FkbM family methyltransferase
VVQVNDYIGRTIYFFGDYDPKITWVCRRVLRAGDCFLDIGANMGVYSLYAAGIVGSRGAVHAFEPQRGLATALERSARLNHFEQLHVHAVALSDRTGEMPLYVPDGEMQAASLSPDERLAASVGLVPLRGCAEYLEGLALGAVRLIKLDVEGHEEQVLRGGLRFLEVTRPPVIVFESHDDGVPFRERPAVSLLAGLEYRFFELPKALLKMTLLPMASDARSSARNFDFVAVLPGREHQDVHRALDLEGV